MEKCTEHAERIATLEAQRISDHSWIEDIHSDHETTKKELAAVKTKLAVIVAVATLAGNIIYKLIERIVPATKALAHLFWPDVYAGD